MDGSKQRHRRAILRTVRDSIYCGLLVSGSGVFGGLADTAMRLRPWWLAVIVFVTLLAYAVTFAMLAAGVAWIAILRIRNQTRGGQSH
jgi:FtsH-binding integral membrane protein